MLLLKYGTLKFIEGDKKAGQLRTKRMREGLRPNDLVKLLTKNGGDAVRAPAGECAAYNSNSISS